MRPKRIPQSKSKSQTHRCRICSCGHIASVHNWYPDDSDGPGTYGRCGRIYCRCMQFTIAKAVSSQSEPLSEPEAYPSTPDVYISRGLHCWFITNSHVKTKIPRFTDKDDPVMVAKYLASKANGPINVVWW